MLQLSLVLKLYQLIQNFNLFEKPLFDLQHYWRHMSQKKNGIETALTFFTVKWNIKKGEEI